MPQPFGKKSPTLTAHPKHLLERPRMAALLGTISSETGQIDRMLLSLFGSLLSGGPIIDSTAPMVFDAVPALTTRLALIHEAIYRRKGKDSAEEFSLIAKQIRKVAIERNKLVHAAWNLAKEYPDDLIMTVPDLPSIRYTEKDFQQTLDRIIVAQSMLRDFLVKTVNFVGGMVPPHSPLPAKRK